MTKRFKIVAEGIRSEPSSEIPEADGLHPAAGRGSRRASGRRRSHSDPNGMDMKRRRARAVDVRRRYREILGRRRLSDAQVDRMRVQVRFLAQAIYEHPWRPKTF
jgi:hypothetical protein